VNKDPRSTGPDVVVVGAARSGTTFLAAQLSAHPLIDAPAVKEPNFYSRHLDKGEAWYDDLFPPRAPGHRRLDASVSYTFPHFPDALAALAKASPSAQVVYVVRDPVARAHSHYELYRHYFSNEPAETFGAALIANPVYLGAGDYAHWLDRILLNFPEEQVLLVPFEASTDDDGAVLDVILNRLGLPAMDEVAADAASTHRNDVVAFKSEFAHRIVKLVKNNPAYPKFRSLVGGERIRKVRSALTKEAPRESLDEALATCTDAQRAELDALTRRATEAVTRHLRAQDARTGLSWADRWVGAAG
jgi:hypothetical protein